MYYADLIGVPYKENGRDLAGLDCYGLCIEAERRLGKTLRDVVYDSHDESLARVFEPTLNVRKTDVIKEGTLLEFAVGDGTLHIAVALDEKTMIHATTNQGVRVSPVYTKKLKNIYEVL